MICRFGIVKNKKVMFRCKVSKKEYPISEVYEICSKCAYAEDL